MFKILFTITILVFCTVLVCGHPVNDLESAATGDEHHGRVQIKVYRGPDEGHESHAPWGYWVKQPADEHH